MEARERRGLARGEVVDALISALGLDRAKREKVARYYEELERGVREPSRVDRRVFEAIGRTLRASVPDLVAWRAFPRRGIAHLPAAPAMAREVTFSSPPAAAAPAEPPDEIDLLFGAK